MTTHSKSPLVCGDCGHKGSIDLSENDQPYSSLWEGYSLDGFDGEKLVITSYADIPANKLEAMKATCPKCGSKQIDYVR